MILSRPFLDWVVRHPALVIGNLFKNPTKVIGLLLGVDESEILPEHKSVLLTSDDWFEMLKVTDEKSVNGLAVAPSSPNGSVAEPMEQKSVDGEVNETNEANGIAEEKSMTSSEPKPSMASFMQEQLSSHNSKPEDENGSVKNFKPALPRSVELEPGSSPQSESFLLKLHRTAFEILSRDSDPPRRTLTTSEKSFQVWPNSVELSKPSARILLLLSSPISSGLRAHSCPFWLQEI